MKYRTENGSFATRNDLKKVPRLGAKAFEQAAGFLRIISGSEPLDNTGIHPESYAIVKEMARQAGVKVKDLPGNTSILDSIDPAELSAKGLGDLRLSRTLSRNSESPGAIHALTMPKQLSPPVSNRLKNCVSVRNFLEL